MAVSRKTVRISTVLVCVQLFIFLPTVNAGKEGKETDCTDMVKTTCTRCHSETRICRKVYKNKSRGAWKRTVNRMIKHGAEAGSAKKERLITCLSTPDPSVRQLCPARTSH